MFNHVSHKSRPHLELHPVGHVPDLQGVVGAEQDVLPEHLHPVLEVPGGQHHVPPDGLVLGGADVLLQVLVQGQPCPPALQLELHVDILLPLVVLVVDLAGRPQLLLQDAGEIDGPPGGRGAECEKATNSLSIIFLKYP